MIVALVLSVACAVAVGGNTGDDEELLAQHAALIVEGAVVQAESQWNGNGTQIYTTVKVVVNDVIKGSLPLEERFVTMRMLGGTVGRMSQCVLDFPVFAPGDRVRLFLRASYQHTLFPLVGFHREKIPIQKAGMGASGELNNDQVQPVEPFRLWARPPTGLQDPHPVVERSPSDAIAFVHWDLREFSECAVPWAYQTEGTPDIDGDGRIDFGDIVAADIVIHDSFNAWTEHSPGPQITFDDAGEPLDRSGIALDGFNLISFVPNAIPVDDVQSVPFGHTVDPHEVCIDPGDDQLLSTQATGDDEWNLKDNVITTGENGKCDTKANNVRNFAGPALASASTFYDIQSHVVIEADIAINSNVVWRAVEHGDIPPAGTKDLQTVLTHEIGHFIGIGHGKDVGAANDGPIMNPGYDSTKPSNHVLHDADRAAINFLYTPEMGDAPDDQPPCSGFNMYQSIVHRNRAGRTLNGMTLDAPAKGPIHVFGHSAAGYPYYFECLGPNDPNNFGNPSDECESRQIDADSEWDDGVELPRQLVRGAKNQITVTISYTQPERYGMPLRLLYFNGYMDTDADCLFDPTDRIMWWSGTHMATKASSTNLAQRPTFDVVAKKIILVFDVEVPADAEDEFYCRFRLDFFDDEGRTDKALDMEPWDDALGPAEGAARFGEVEDYLCEAAGCPWDCADGDGQAGATDLIALLGQWGGPGSCDYDGGGVGVTDLLILLEYWGPCEAGALAEDG